MRALAGICKKDVNSHAILTQILHQVADVRWVGVWIVTLQWIDAHNSHAGRSQSYKR